MRLRPGYAGLVRALELLPWLTSAAGGKNPGKGYATTTRKIGGSHATKLALQRDR